MLTLASTNRETEPAGTGPLEDPISHQGVGGGRDRTGRMARAIGERLGGRRALCPECPHHGTADLTGTPLER